MQAERWVKVPFYPAYHISTAGQVRRMTKARGARAGLMLTHYVRPDGYHVVNLRRGGLGCVRFVHRLVLEAFVGPCPPGMEACHFDGNKGNNTLSNLRWDTRAGNMHDQSRHGKTNRGEKAHNAVLTPDLVRDIRQMRADGIPIRQVAAYAGVAESTVSLAVHRKNWAHIQ